MLGLQLLTWKYISEIYLSEKKFPTNEFRQYNLTSKKKKTQKKVLSLCFKIGEIYKRRTGFVLNQGPRLLLKKNSVSFSPFGLL